MKIKDIMIKEVISLDPEMSVKEALDILLRREISGLPVVDKDRNLLGMFTEKDVLKNILPSYLEKVGKFVYQEDPKIIRKKLQDLLNSKVRDVMRKEVATVKEDAILSEVASLMLTQRARRILVVDMNNKLIGIISRGDVVKAFLKIL